MAAGYCKRMIVRGRVQGVGFRFHVIHLSEDYDVTGFVRNLPDGGVEIVAEGSSEQVEAFIERAAQGPPGSRVREVKTYLEQPRGCYNSFGVRY